MQEIIDHWSNILHAYDVFDSQKKDEEQEQFVEKLCWHCCHAIKCKTLQYPFKLNNNGKFTVGGQFCSWECIKGYARDDMSRVLSGVHQLNIRHYRKMITGLMDPVLPAPPRMTLKAFGGHLTIEEFRNPRPNVEYVINYAKLVKVTPYDAHEYKFENRFTKQEDKSLVLESSTIVNDSLKLRRPKPAVKGKSTLERSLGLNTFGNLIRTS